MTVEAAAASGKRASTGLLQKAGKLDGSAGLRKDSDLNVVALLAIGDYRQLGEPRVTNGGKLHFDQIKTDVPGEQCRTRNCHGRSAQIHANRCGNHRWIL